MSSFTYGQILMWKPARGQKLITVRFLTDCSVSKPFSGKDESVIFMPSDNRTKVVSAHNLFLPTRTFRVSTSVEAVNAVEAIAIVRAFPYKRNFSATE